jgi:hypothetical protein
MTIFSCPLRAAGTPDKVTVETEPKFSEITEDYGGEERTDESQSGLGI